MESWKICNKGVINKIPATDNSIPADCAKVKVVRAGISSTDIALYRGKLGSYPTTPCRIAAGLISESSDITLKKGQRVLLSPYSRLDNKIAIHGLDVEGYLADYTIVPIRDIYVMPEGMSDESITFIEDIAMALKMLELLNIQKTEYVLVYGASDINIIFAQLCIYYQTIPILIDNDPNKLEIASQLGIYYQVDTSSEDLSDKLKDITSGKSAECAIVDTDLGRLTQVDEVLKSLQNGGKVGIYGYNTSVTNLNADYSPIISKNLTIYGLNNGYGEIETAINMLATETIKIDGLYNEITDISEVPNTFTKLSEKQNFFKTIVKC